MERRNGRGFPARIARLAAAVAVCIAGLAVPARSDPRGEAYFTNLPLVTQHGEEVRFYDDLIRGKIVVIDFVYTECPGVCSLTTARLAQIYEWLGDRVGRDIFFYSITLDPENDTPEKLKSFAEAFGIGDGWLFLTGRREDIDVIRHRLGERARKLTEHRTDLVVGNDRTGFWRRSSAMGSLTVAAQSILEMDPAWKAPPIEAVASDPGGYDFASHPGEALFLRTCASCHTVGGGDRHGPDLAGVTLRRDRDWLVRYITAPDAMLAKGDDLAVALDRNFPDVRMPNLRLSEADAEDLVRYLDSELDRLQREADSSGASLAFHDHASHDHGDASHDHDHAAHDHGDAAGD